MRGVFEVSRTKIFRSSKSAASCQVSKFAEPAHFCVIRASVALFCMIILLNSGAHITQCTHKKRVKGAIEVGMSSCEDSDVEEERPDVLDMP